MLSEIKNLLLKEILLELRQKYALNGILLYVASSVFVVYLSFKVIHDKSTWNALLWIILLFASTNAVAKSFIQENKGRQLYLYSLASPGAIILSKVIYNMILLIALSLLTFFFFILFAGNPVEDFFYYVLSLILGSMGFSSVLTLVSAISSKTNNNVTLMAVLSFPLLMPLLITLIRFSKNAMDGIDRSMSMDYILVLVLMNLIIIILSYLLFPYLWRD
jgi:heme exporter protein B